MAISYTTFGSAAGHVSSINIGYPSGVQAGDILLAIIGTKYPPAAPATPSGFTLLGQVYGGSSAPGGDSGPTMLTVFYKIATGAETGTIAINAAGATDTIGIMIGYRSDVTGNVWGIQSAVKERDDAGTPWTVTMDDDLSVQSGDLVIQISAANTDAGDPSAYSLSLTGVTFGSATERIDYVSGFGDDVRLIVADHPVSSGSGTGKITASFNYSNSNANRPQGGTLVLVLREEEEEPEPSTRRIFLI